MLSSVSGSVGQRLAVELAANRQTIVPAREIVGSLLAIADLGLSRTFRKKGQSRGMGLRSD